MKIGMAAKEAGVDAHVLRHWDEMGVVVPDRAPSGHREYTSDQVTRLRVVRACQEVGMSLAEIRLILHRDEAGRAEVIGDRLARIRSQRSQLEDAERYLEHVLGCTHDLLSRCPDCTRYASGGRPSS
ncbi:MerR family transcriptional regulator [Arthrobacter sp. Y-9]|uniref:helix-turn-helix domain-containing protein n=1 Tax=Arthrobacter sp. Y-9 TaxID=3039385 RepID=UPI00241C1DAA|nr:MerR family transcriptional regulator [Arthrobacter sp. Y-9]WFR82982.1 MerR family transcriptional regulator [Arthrobacter sp. Y-9]